MMIGIPLMRCDADPVLPPGEFTAVVGMAGPIHGVFSIRCDEKTACGIGSGMLGVPREQARAEICDALGEVCNMVIGSFKHKIGQRGASSVLSVPTVIHGCDYEVRPLSRGTTLLCRLKTQDGMVQLRFDYNLGAGTEPPES